MVVDSRPFAALVLADGTIFRGRSIGAAGETLGEVVFNTAITGYQEILTDPSYAGQIVTLTYPHVGNTGINDEDVESSRVRAAGLVIRDLPVRASNFRSRSDLSTYLQEQGVVGIADIDTRKLTRILRERGAQAGCIIAMGSDEELSGATLQHASDRARSHAGMAGQDLAKVVSARQPYQWNEGSWQLARSDGTAGFVTPAAQRFHVVAYDFGVKQNILRLMADRGCRISIVPAQTAAADVLKLNPDGVFLANGPGDPEPCEYAVRAVREFVARKVPTFGICLGHQILGLAVGARTLKMKFGHHGANHPVLDVDTRKVYITSQNHGFAVDETTLPSNARVTHVSLFDGSLQGFALTDAPAFCFQGHPEASPGPHDICDLFDRFIELISARRRQLDVVESVSA
ncbi:MAG: glutamine-hydrolyzing carbamoyl-phosphate synthase small subunit [Burkholderiaceae bacterium]|nr:glutamine-hydrolyzing carbamoyl-phosphate synthase small subunit [Burkholderiaceae bacterium]